MRNWRCSARWPSVSVCVLALAWLTACSGQGGPAPAPPANSLSAGAPAAGGTGALDLPESGGDEMADGPSGNNPALHYGPFEVEQRFVDISDGQNFRTAFYFVPHLKRQGPPYPTLVWGHGFAGAFLPYSQSEIFRRAASHGFLVIYPNVPVEFPLPESYIVNGVTTYLTAIKRAVDEGLADPERIIFGGYSMGARLAALAAIEATGRDLGAGWPRPIAVVLEALPDMTANPRIPGPQPSEWAQYIDPEIPVTVLCAANDEIVRNFDWITGEPIDGIKFFMNLPSRFAQLIVLRAGTGPNDAARHESFLAWDPGSLDNFDLWGHMKIVAGMLDYHFRGGSRVWAYGALRGWGGVDVNHKPIFHLVIEQRNPPPGQIAPNGSPPSDSASGGIKSQKPEDRSAKR